MCSSLARMLFILPIIIMHIIVGRAYAFYGLKNDQVQFVVVRLDLQTKELKGYYASSQPFYIGDIDPGYTEIGQISFKIMPRVDEWYLSLRSVFTGGNIFFGVGFFGGTGSIIFPRPDDFWPNIGFGYVHSAPDTIVASTMQWYGTSEGIAQEIWTIIKGADFVSWIAENGEYSIYIFWHYYSVGPGGFRSEYKDWIAILYNIPTLPGELIFAGMESPRGMMTINVPVAPKVRLLNRGSETADGTVRLKITNGNGVLYESELWSGDILPDSSRMVEFEPFTHSREDSLTFRFSLENDALEDLTWTQVVAVIADPVFRGDALFDNTSGGLPPAGVLNDSEFGNIFYILSHHGVERQYWKSTEDGGFIDCTSDFTRDQLLEKMYWIYNEKLNAYGDIDNDGYADSISFKSYIPELFLYREPGNYEHVPNVFDVPSTITSAVILDFNDDGINDVLFARFYDSAMILKGEGGLVFTDVTNEIGPLPEAVNVDAGDVNGDGFPDIIMRKSDNGRIALFMNQSGKSFIDKTYLLNTRNKFIPREGPNYGQYANILDMDGDGDLDIYWEFAYYENLGFNPIPTGIEEEKNIPAIPSKYELHAVYPNPFNPTTTIRFDLPEAANVRIVIYNVLGQQVVKLVNSNLPAGSHQRVWDGTRFSSGIYLVRMEAAGYSETVKMTLVK